MWCVIARGGGIRFCVATKLILLNDCVPRAQLSLGQVLNLCGATFQVSRMVELLLAHPVYRSRVNCAHHCQRSVNSNCRCESQILIPDPFYSMVKKLNFFTLDVLVLVNLNCLRDYDWRTGFLLRCSTPLVLVVIIKAVAIWRARAALGQGPKLSFETTSHLRGVVTHWGLCARCCEDQNAS